MKPFIRYSLVSYCLILLFGAFRFDDFKAYKQEVPGTTETFEMLPIPAGEFLMGSPANEEKRKNDEGPQHSVKVEPFWMSKYEVTWDLYEVFANTQVERPTDKIYKVPFEVVARPTQPYVEMSFGQGKQGGFPVCNVTQFAARAYCKWLYAKTGNFYRLPTEAEWEYAARAGTTTTYFFGNDAASMKDYAWFYDNSDGAYKKVGQKKPNPWGLYDMYGNVSEWTSDEYEADFYGKPEATEVNPFKKPNNLYPQTIRGGNWDDDTDALRSAARKPSTPQLKQRDPQIPKSDWWLTDAPFLGFRVVRPVKQPSKEEIEEYFKRSPKDLGNN